MNLPFDVHVTLRNLLAAAAVATTLATGAAARSDPCAGTDLIAALPEDQRANLMTQVAAEPYGTGNLWQAKRGDTTLTLFGTYHMRHARTDADLAALIPHIEAAETVFFEMSGADSEAFQKRVASDPSIMFLTTGPTLPDLLPPAEWDQLSEEMSARGIPGFMAARFKPVWAGLMLGMGPCAMRAGLLDAPGIDIKIAEAAADLGVPERSLEDPATILALLDGDTIEEQIDFLRLSFAMADQADDMHYTLLSRYLNGEIALIWAYSEWAAIQSEGPQMAAQFAEMEQVLLTDRNRAWVDLLLTEAPGRRVMIAVGAAHLPGENGVLRMLERAGFAISPLVFDP